jgi:cob(I)alamin adenosyltransferase
VKAGYIQLYTGNGKGKTTAAFGVALRMLGAGGKVFVGQFLKSGDFSEIKAFRKWKESIRIEQFGSGKFIVGQADNGERELAKRGFETCKSALFSGEYDLVVLDEITHAI